jgi:ATP-binding cassette, subfamily B, bacterial IrtB/YbtQ
MYDTIQNRLALSRKGAKDLLKGVFFTALLNLGLMLPAVYTFAFLDDYLRGVLDPARTPAHGVVYYSLLGIGFMLVTWVLGLLQYRSTYTTIYEESANRRISLAEKLRRLPLAFFGHKNLSDLTSTIMGDNTDLEHTFSHAVPQLFASFVSLFLVALGLFIYEWRLALALFWSVPVAVSMVALSKAWQHRGNRLLYLNKRAVSEGIQEGLEMAQEIRSCRMEDQYLDKLDQIIDTFERNMTRVELLVGLLLNGAASVLRLGTASVILAGAHLLSSGTVELFTYLVFLLVASRVFEPIGEVFNNLAALFFLDVRIDRMREMQALPIQKGDTAFVPKHYDIEFNNVSFSYEDGRQVLDGVTFTAKQGEVTALIGPSGGGKTTAAMLAARFWDADRGTVTLGGRNLREVDPETLLKSYSVVFQNVVLFNASVIDNIRIGKQSATDQEALRAARLAECDEFVARMKDGYRTLIGENGVKLSGGERQRLSIARALLKDAPIVLLDEATASLDVENETKIQVALSKLTRSKTVILVAHRMRTVAHADKVVLLDKGRVLEAGRPEDLGRQGGLFAQMVARQMGASP